MNHIHAAGVVHRDLKPENIMIDNDGDPRVIDFGLSKDTKGGAKLLKSMVGSRAYMAPEILQNHPHSYPCDMWSMGIILYLMLSGNHPFNAKNLDHDIIETPVMFYPGMGWNEISKEAQDLVRGLLEKDYSNRLTASQALNHPWFKNQLNDNSFNPKVQP